MSKQKPRRPAAGPTTFDQARDEMFSHILRCGVMEAEPQHRDAWFDDTVQYLQERYTGLSPEELAQLRTLGERYCRPVQRTTEPAAGEPAITEPAAEPATSDA